MGERQKPVGDAAFGEIEAAQENAGLSADRVGDDLVMSELMLQRRFDDVLVDLEELGRELDEHLDRKPAMAFVGRLLQGERDPGPNPLRRLAGNAHLHGYRVGGPKADAFNVAREPIRVFSHHLNGVMAIGLEDAHRPRRSDAVRMQEDHDVADSLLLGPARGDLAGAELADAGHFPQLLWVRFDDFEGRFAESADDPLGEFGTDAANHARAEIFLDAFGRRRWSRLEKIRLELQAMRAIGDPDADGVDEFAGRDRSRMPNDRDEITPPARLHLEDCEAILLIVKGHPLDRADERLTGRSGLSGGLQGSLPLLEVEG